MRNYIIALVFSMFAVACGTSDPSEGFVGAYQNTITLTPSTGGAVTANDALSISDGTASDLVFQSQQLGALRVSISGKTSFSIDQQQITLQSSTGPVTVTMMGQGTIVDHVFSANGTLAAQQGLINFTWNGQKL